MVVLSFFLLGLLLILFQTTVFMLNPVWGWSPDLYYVLIAYLAYRLDLMRSLIILFPLSCFLDVLSGTILGMYPILCFGGYFLLKLMASKLPVRESLYQIPLIGVSFLAVSWLVFVVLTFLESEVLIPWSWPRMLVRAGLVVLFAFPLFKFFEFINKRLQAGLQPFKKLRIRTTGNQYR